MGVVSGSVTINTTTWALETDLSGACGSVYIAIHEFPVIYGAFQDPCDQDHIGQTCYEVSLGGKAQVTVDQSIRYHGRSLVLKTCDQQTCVNLEVNPQRVWKAIVRSFMIGQVYFLQPSNLQPFVGVIELALLEGMATRTASIFFSDTCQVDIVRLLGSVKVGNHQKFAKSRLEINMTDVSPYLVVQYEERRACAMVRLIPPKEASAQFSMQGIKGSFRFKQDSPFHPTLLTINIRGLQGLADHYGIHALPILARRQADENLCVEVNTGELWNPLKVVREGNGHGSRKIGDLSGRHGTLRGLENYRAVLIDWNLPLHGNNSIIGRSLLISKAGGEPWACSTLNLDGEIITALATFRKGVVGRIMFQQAPGDLYNDLTIYIELADVSHSVSRNHKWHVHQSSLSRESEECANAGGHFNPYNVPTNGNYSQECNPTNPLRCEAGDFAGSHAPITLLAPIPARYLFTDSSTSLTGSKSIIGRSVVIHGSEGGSSRVACANILLQPVLEGRTGLWFGPGDASGEVKASQVFESMPTVIDISLHGLRCLAVGFHIHLLPVSEVSDNPCSDEEIGGHFNPFHVNISGSPAAGQGTDDEYEVGDISGRHGSLLNLFSKTGQFKDMNFPLSGPHGVLGRSLVIHYVNGSR